MLHNMHARIALLIQRSFETVAVICQRCSSRSASMCIYMTMFIHIHEGPYGERVNSREMRRIKDLPAMVIAVENSRIIT